MNSSFGADCHVAQQTRRDKLRFDPDPHQPPPSMFGFPSGSGDLHMALYKPDPTTNFQSNLDLLPYNSSPQLYHDHELAQIIRPNQNQAPSLTLAPNNSHYAIGPGPGPLGPFTGYAAVLKGSRFLEPAQMLLEELCGAVKGGRGLCVNELGECVFGGSKEGNSGEGVSSSSLSTSTELSCGVDHSRVKVHRPEFQQKKAKLLYMQDEVCRRYKQYHQQMQMVVSSFESVPGLNYATPYTRLALKSIAKNFRRLKNIISSQIQQISQILGEEPTSSPSSSRAALLSHNRLPYMEHNHPVWRPQRGLPERAVSVLRAWLFDHFLHPYPTDADKHMLASQTGLSRNQVSNWFINARVRLWKPMVEEIHMLETKGKNGLGSDHNSTSNLPDSKTSVPSRARQFSNQGLEDHQHANTSLDCGLLDQMWHVDKRSRVQDEAMEGNLISFGGFSGSEMDMGGFGGAVSLTLGLRHDGVQQPQHQQLRQFGGQMLHDFVG
ncbi:hypothetical protein LUZ62_036306 [Rhynchospora pubera]|uniref:Homeobox domain-containing protein n=1 Tax=Rhynchospora pubera TaxID=906938 RepID=A0AAV8EUK2_9POAL|nr:hypothetical protein LUZ62_057885 [Rhynchospora pubera]KAJ4785060.1 hypothetical protein LUZ62_036306 [Rhynchospora pubera]